MKRTRVASSNITSIGYDADLEVLEVEFRTGAVYCYSDVPAKIYRALMGAGSIGTAFHKLVRLSFKAELQPPKEQKTRCNAVERKNEQALPKGHVRAHRVVCVRR
jgi:hypothetical protein